MSRKLDLAKFRDDDSDDETMAFVPKKALELNALKSKTFSHGLTSKSKKDLEKEAEERKRLEEERALALVNAEMEEAFASSSAGSGTVGAGMRAFGGGGRPIGPGGGFVRAGGAPAGPSSAFQPPSGPRGDKTPRGPAAMGYARPAPPKVPSPPPSGPPKRGKRVLDSFLEEIKGNQQHREDRLSKLAKQEGSSVVALAAWEGISGGRPVVQAESTNLYVSNLPYTVTEESLGMLFAEVGPVGTVKIMWPRGEEMKHRSTASLMGFVQYMKREHGEKALLEMEGLSWGGNVLHVGWSKPMPMPQMAKYDLTSRKRDRSASPKRHREGRDEAPSGSHSPGRARRRSDSRSPRRQRSYSSGSSRSGSRSPPRRSAAETQWLSKIDPEQEKFVRAVASRIRDHGKGFEDVLRTKEKDNPKFAFLFDETLGEYHLCKSVISSRYRYPTPPPDAFDDDGYASVYSSDSAEDSEKERTTKGKMGKLARKRFEALLRAMSGKRSEIARAMEFAMSRAEAADEIADLICSSLQLDETPVPRKVARLHLVSDILHNSASPLPNVWKYRLAFETRLPAVFAHLADVHQSLLAYSGNISADVFKQQIRVILDIWEGWIVFTQDVSSALRGLLDGTRSLSGAQQTHEQGSFQETKSKPTEEETRSKFKSSGFKSSFKPLAETEPAAVTGDEDLDGEALDGEAIDDVDGEAMDLDGESMDGEAMDREAMELDGEMMDDDVDGEAM